MPPRARRLKDLGVTRNSVLDDQSWVDRAFWGNSEETLQYNTNRNPLSILQTAFKEYIIGTPIESATLGIEITYIEANNTTPRTMFVLKRNYENQISHVRAGDTSDAYLSQTAIDNGVTFENNQLNQLLRTVNNFRILQMMLSEVYNDDPESRRRAQQQRDGTRGRRFRRHYYNNGYYPVSIPIRLLYRNVTREIIEATPLTYTRMVDNQRTEDFNNLWQRNNSIQQQSRLLLTRDEIAALSQPSHEEMEQILQREAGRIQAEQRARHENRQTDEEIRALFDRLTVEGEIQDTDLNPDQLTVVKDSSILNKPMSSYVWAGRCGICFDDDKTGLCRVNCDAGHVFHCDCINGWRNVKKNITIAQTVPLSLRDNRTRWNDDCPICNQPISTMVHVTPEVASSLPSSFGKKSKKVLEKRLKSLEKEIKYFKRN